MKNTYLKIALGLFLSPFFASLATAGDPCAPTVRARPSYMGCRTAEARYNITIETMMSPVNDECPMSKHVEIHTANIEVFKLDWTPVAKLKIENDFFTYEGGLPGTGSGYLTSPILSLDLRGCDRPANGGGLSSGN